MDLRNLKTFISVAELASFTRAAEQLGFSQSTVSFQIKQLERELGAHLFERTRHAMKLPYQGREVLRYAYQMAKLTQVLGPLSRNQSEDRYRWDGVSLPAPAAQ